MSQGSLIRLHLTFYAVRNTETDRTIKYILSDFKSSLYILHQSSNITSVEFSYFCCLHTNLKNQGQSFLVESKDITRIINGGQSHVTGNNFKEPYTYYIADY